MKRSLLLTVCAATAVALVCGQAMATVTVSLNLRYTDPANESAGGTWQLLASDTSAFGISAIVAVIDGISNPTLNGGIGAIPIETQTDSGITEFVYGQDPATSPVAGVGKGTVAAQPDDLFPSGANPYNGFSLIASGDFGATRPAFATFPGAAQGGVTEANVWVDAAMSAGSGPETIEFGIGNPANGGVRGDSVATDGLKVGDANRDGSVNGSDFAILGGNWQGPGGWDQGDFNSSGTVDGSDFALLGGTWQTSSTPPAIGAVPEPSTVLLGLLGSMGLFCRRRNQ